MYVLSKGQIDSLMSFLDTRMKFVPCGHSLKWTKVWIHEAGESWRENEILEELRSMGGVCDCTVYDKCYL